MSTITEKLEHLKRTLHPEETLNVIDQCAIVSEALGFGSKYDENRHGLAEYLNVSSSLVYKMKYIHDHAIPEVKAWFRQTTYQGHTTYDTSVLSPEGQLQWLKNMDVLITGGFRPPGYVAKDENWVEAGSLEEYKKGNPNVK